MPLNTEKYSYHLFTGTSTNVSSTDLLHSLLGQHTASRLPVINPYIEVLAHTCVLDIYIFQHTTWYLVPGTVDVHH